MTVELYKNGVKVGQATTSATGEYYFVSGTNATDANTSDNIIHDSGIGILPDTGTSGGNSLYEIRIPNVNGGSKQAALGTNLLTTANAGSNDSIDSDGTIPSGQTYASYALPYADLASAGSNNHTYDFGFSPVGTIQIVKNTVGNDGTFTFTSADTQLDAVSITTVGNTGNSGAAFTKNIGTYTLSEDAPAANWALTSLSCTGDSDNGSVVTLASRQVAIDLDANENIVCTFTNTYTPPTGTIQIVKNSTGGNGSFGFTSPNATLDAIHLTTVGGTASSAVMTMSPGSYTLSEDALVGWSLTNLVCTGDTDNGSAVTLANRQVVIDLDANENIVCTFSNTAQSSSVVPSGVLTLTKSVVGSSNSGPYAVTVTGPNGYSNNTSVTAGAPTVLTGLTQGVYTVTETSPGAGWVTTYTVGAVNSSVSGVVNLQNTNSVTRFTPTGPITGKVYNDYNSDGNLTANGTITDTGVANVKVTVYGIDGTLLAATQSDATGNYSIAAAALTVQGPYRVEFTNLPSGYEPSRVASGTQNGASVQFVNIDTAAARTLNFGVLDPCDYCQSNPMLATPIHIYGDQQVATVTFVDFPYSSGAGVDATVAAYDNPTTHAINVQANLIGSAYGVAAHGASRSYFVGAYVKRHAGLGSLGSQSTGAIYRINSAGTATLFADLNALLGTNTAGANPHPTATTNFDVDAAAFGAVGTVGLGDLDIAEDGSGLYVMNLANRSLYYLPVSNPPTTPSASSILNYPVPINLPGATNPCAASDVRPFGLGVRNGRVYVGMVCSGLSSATVDTFTDSNNNGSYNISEAFVDNDGNGTYNRGDVRKLFAYVYALNPSTASYGTAPVLEFPLNYQRGGASSTLSASYSANWQAWGTSFYQMIMAPGGTSSDRTIVFPQPMLSDIEFDGNDMIIGLRDRFGDQSATGALGTNSGDTISYFPLSVGDILRACKQASGGWAIENNGSCGGTTTSGGAANSGPGGREYYSDDSFGIGAFRQNPETVLGGVAVWPGTNQVATTVFDPANITAYDAEHFDSAGVKWLNNTTGTSPRSYRVVDVDYPNFRPYFGKSSALGDLELLCDPAPIEIGNRVWNDLDGDGVQDAGEPGLSGLTVSLQGPTNTVTANTDANGLYYFNNLKQYSAYTLTMSVPAGYSLTAANQAALSGASVVSNQAISDTIDSDAALIGGKATIYYSTGSAGQNNHGLDFGFTQPVKGQVDILNTALTSYTLVKTLNTADPVKPGDPISFTIRITNTGGALITTLPLSDTYDTRYLQYVSTSVAAVDNNDDGQIDWSDVTGAGSLAAGAHLDVIVNFVAFHDTTLLPSGATVNTASSGTHTSSAPVRINAPTAVEIADKMVQVVDDQVVVQWRTVSETPLVGFYLWREDGRGQMVRVTSNLILAQKAGQSNGAAYRYTDPTAIPGAYYRYVLELVDTDNHSSYSEVGRVGGLIKLYLSAVRR